jgi:hypothetical protein
VAVDSTGKLIYYDFGEGPYEASRKSGIQPVESYRLIQHTAILACAHLPTSASPAARSQVVLAAVRAIQRSSAMRRPPCIYAQHPQQRLRANITHMTALATARRHLPLELKA